jgi:sugar lactone lactonase YvrE
MSVYQVQRVLDIKAELGEGALWSVEEQALFWVDIHGKTINRFDPVSRVNRVFAAPGIPGSLAFRANRGVIIATDQGLFDLDLETGETKLLLAAPFDNAEYRFNDGKTDRQGRFWVGTVLIHRFEANANSYYRFEAGLAIKAIDPITVSNGTAFSPDGRTLYRAESMERVIYAMDYDPDCGIASNQRSFATVPKHLGIPDGATVDAEGGYWVAVPYGDECGNVVRFDSGGNLDVQIPLPVLGPTCVSFGGPTLSTLYVTTGRLEHLFKRPPSEWGGDLFAIETQFRGLPETPYAAGGSAERASSCV